MILTGCANSTPPSRPPIPANLASPCPAVVSFTSASWDELMKSYLKLVIQYSECAGKHAAVSDVNK
ncbi:Rz1-like lysis system protein LysC [Zwartia sp.]|uniref:Rz1-like lysis system protein LysC n=1 Tax=Zwartia sp. TaxID=2978004 RepID=UPI003BAFF646